MSVAAKDCMRNIAELLQRRGGTAHDVALLMHFSTLACEALAVYDSESFATLSATRAASVATDACEPANDRDNLATGAAIRIAHGRKHCLGIEDDIDHQELCAQEGVNGLRSTIRSANPAAVTPNPPESSFAVLQPTLAVAIRGRDCRRHFQNGHIATLRDTR